MYRVYWHGSSEQTFVTVEDYAMKYLNIHGRWRSFPKRRIVVKITVSDSINGVIIDGKLFRKETYV